MWGTSCRRDSHCQLLACSPVGNNGEDPQGQNPPWDQLLSQAMLLCASLGLPVPHTGNELPNSRRKCPRAGISREDSPAASPPQLCCTLTSCLLCKHSAGSSSPLPNSLAMRWSQILPAILAKETKPLQRCPYSGALPARRGQSCCRLSGESHTSLPWGQWDPVPITLPVIASASWMSGHHCLTRPTVPVGLSNPNTLFFKGLMDFAPFFSQSRRPQVQGDTGASPSVGPCHLEELLHVSSSLNSALVSSHSSISYLRWEGRHWLPDPAAAGVATCGTAEPHHQGWHNLPLWELKSGQTLILANSRGIPADSSGPAQNEMQMGADRLLLTASPTRETMVLETCHGVPGLPALLSSPQHPRAALLPPRSL